jgi:hypothetical protein
MSQITWQKFLKEIDRTEEDAKDWSLETLKSVCETTSFKKKVLELADIESRWKKLQALSTTAQQAPPQGISTQAFLCTPLSTLFMETPNVFSSHQSSTMRVPNKLIQWASFTKNAAKYTLDGQMDSSPSFPSSYHISDEQGVRTYLTTNVYLNLHRAIPVYQFTDKQKGTIAATDMGCYGKGEQGWGLLYPIEVKTPWSLPPIDLFDTYCDDQSKFQTHIKNHTHQLFGYMAANHRRFGVLTSYVAWFFFKCDEQNQLYVSNKIDFGSTDPSVMQTLAYLASLSATSDGGCVLPEESNDEPNDEPNEEPNDESDNESDKEEMDEDYTPWK